MAVIEKTVDIIGDTALCDILLSKEAPEGTLIDLYDDTVKFLRMNGLYGNRGIRSMTFTAMTSISTESIERCQDLVSVDVPAVLTIASSGIRDNVNLEEVNAPLVESIGQYAFSGDTKLQEAVFPQVQYIDQGAFYGCGSVTRAEFPKLRSIGNYAIASFVQLTQLDLPSVTSIGSELLYADSQVTVVNIGPNIETINAVAFRKTTDDLVINLAVSEGVVSGAPWGATGATINYDVPYSGTVPMPT